MVAEFFVMDGNLSVSAVAILPEAEATLLALKRADPVGFEIAVNIITDVFERVLRFVNDETSKDVPTSIASWWRGPHAATLSAIHQNLKVEFFKGYPQTLIGVQEIISSRT